VQSTGLEGCEGCGSVGLGLVRWSAVPRPDRWMVWWALRCEQRGSTQRVKGGMGGRAQGVSFAFAPLPEDAGGASRRLGPGRCGGRARAQS
jgi:hypothetical protein